MYHVQPLIKKESFDVVKLPNFVSNKHHLQHHYNYNTNNNIDNDDGYGDTKKSRAASIESWKVRMREKYDIDTSEFNYNPEHELNTHLKEQQRKVKTHYTTHNDDSDANNNNKNNNNNNNGNNDGIFSIPIHITDTDEWLCEATAHSDNNNDSVNNNKRYLLHNYTTTQNDSDYDNDNHKKRSSCTIM